MNSVWTDASPGWTTYGPEQTQNASEIYTYLVNWGCSSNAAYAILGNMQHESYLNPGQWQIGSNYDPSAGFGLCQWTPSTKISDITGPSPADMSNYLDQLGYLINTPGQWSTQLVDSSGWSSYYNLQVPYIASWQDFKTDTTHSVADLTKAFMACWERPAAAYAAVPQRVAYAMHWAGQGPTPPLPITPAIMIILLAKAASRWRL